ncbi:Hypothetical predicted protein [Lecanosticta acicola]|uniref:Uncharacterized protein n=1 Tax=Lecanosticta acicola TaxID=111012 RepID=A0AAI8YT79_9PEZI|nr:Hypothetical predicted protein [Lecanosticta acicola]
MSPNYLEYLPHEFAEYAQRALHGQLAGQKIHSLRIHTFLFSPWQRLLVLQEPADGTRLPGHEPWGVPSTHVIFPRSAEGEETVHTGDRKGQSSEIRDSVRVSARDSIHDMLEQIGGQKLRDIGKEGDDVIFGVDGGWSQSQAGVQEPSLTVNLAVVFHCSANVDLTSLERYREGRFGLNGREY